MPQLSSFQAPPLYTRESSRVPSLDCGVQKVFHLKQILPGGQDDNDSNVPFHLYTDVDLGAWSWGLQGQFCYLLKTHEVPLLFVTHFKKQSAWAFLFSDLNSECPFQDNKKVPLNILFYIANLLW